MAFSHYIEVHMLSYLVIEMCHSLKTVCQAKGMKQSLLQKLANSLLKYKICALFCIYFNFTGVNAVFLLQCTII